MHDVDSMPFMAVAAAAAELKVYVANVMVASSKQRICFGLVLVCEIDMIVNLVFPKISNNGICDSFLFILAILGPLLLLLLKSKLH